MSSARATRHSAAYLSSSAVNLRSAARTWRGETVPPLAGAGRSTRVPVRVLWPRMPLRLEPEALTLSGLRLGLRITTPMVGKLIIAVTLCMRRKEHDW